MSRPFIDDSYLSFYQINSLDRSKYFVNQSYSNLLFGFQNLNFLRKSRLLVKEALHSFFPIRGEV